VFVLARALSSSNVCVTSEQQNGSYQDAQTLPLWKHEGDMRSRQCNTRTILIDKECLLP
jgi:hypothetical protein